MQNAALTTPITDGCGKAVPSKTSLAGKSQHSLRFRELSVVYTHMPIFSIFFSSYRYFLISKVTGFPLSMGKIVICHIHNLFLNFRFGSLFDIRPPRAAFTKKNFGL